ncbi:MAG: YfcC family protein, partial [Olsenella sp.]|nr:YfcC family protein [Olsenella sp.]
IGSYLLYFLLSFLIPSTSGMATVSMPIMGPLAAQLGFNPAVMVMVFSAASGAVNLITPTSGAIMGGLALSRIEYSTWVKFAIKIVATIAVVSMIILTIAMLVIPA